jgi:hypothetical protein
LLAVRAFALQQPLAPLRPSDLPIPIEVPTAFRDIGGLAPVSAFVYSVHHYENRKPVIGDIAVKLRKGNA